MLAVRNGYLPTSEGVAIRPVDREALTPEEIARNSGHKKIAETILLCQRQHPAVTTTDASLSSSVGEASTHRFRRQSYGENTSSTNAARQEQERRGAPYNGCGSSNLDND